MKKFVQIYNNKAWWIFESEEMPKFAPDIVIKEITNLAPQPQEGWDYDEETNTFSPPIINNDNNNTIDTPTIEDKVNYLYYKSKGVI